MKLFKTKKQKILFITMTSLFTVAAATSLTIYFSNKNHKSSFYYSSQTQKKPNFVGGDNIDLDAVPSNSDSDLKKLPIPPEPPKKQEIPPVVQKIPEIEKPKETPKLKPVPEPKPEPKPEPTPAPAPKPQPIPKPEVKPAPKPKPKNQKTLIRISGVEVEADITPAADRVSAAYDVTNKITNRVPYVNDSTEKLNSITVTNELREKAVQDVLGNSNSAYGLRSHAISMYVGFAENVLKRNQNDPDKLHSFIRQNEDFWHDVFYKFQRLFDSPNIKNFLQKDKVKEYESITFTSKEHRYIWLYSNLDWTKFTKLSSNAENYLKKGYVLDPSNAYINEDGTLDSHAYSQPDRFNSVTSRLSRDNNTRRVFSYDSHWNRSPDDIRDGTYPGWKSRDATQDAIFKDLIRPSEDGIRVKYMEREKKTNIPNQINEGYVIEIDAANEAGYNKTLDLINKLKEQNKSIVSYRIKNMGKNDSAQKFKHILSALPNDILQVELFFSAQATNTSSLIALENKNIKELSLYTLGNSLQDEWSLNPFALRNTAWVNTNDYNVSSQYGNLKNIATRITFNTLAFDKEDYLEHDTDHFSRINLGLRMAYYTRNNEPIFQGSWGPGLSPDHNEGGNSYPTMLDFSRVPQIRTLHGLEFHDKIKSSNKSRKITKVTFYNNSETYEIGEKDLKQAGLENMATGPYETPKIRFSNGRTTTKFRVRDNDLSSESISNLLLFKKYAYNNDSAFTGTVVLNQGTTSLGQKLKNAGLSVEYDTGYEIN